MVPESSGQSDLREGHTFDSDPSPQFEREQTYDIDSSYVSRGKGSVPREDEYASNYDETGSLIHQAE